MQTSPAPSADRVVGTQSHASAGLLELWRFPVADANRRRDMIRGGLLFLFVPLVGWILNLGHRWRVMERLYHGDAPWFRGFRPLGGTFMRGLGVGTLGLTYLLPGLLVMSAGMAARHEIAVALGLTWALAAFYSFPVGISRFAQRHDFSWYARPHRAFVLAVRHGLPYLRMWMYTCLTIGVSVIPLFIAVIAERVDASAWWWLAIVPFAFLSPWAWSALGYGFGTILVPETLERERAMRRPR